MIHSDRGADEEHDLGPGEVTFSAGKAALLAADERRAGSAVRSGCGALCGAGACVREAQAQALEEATLFLEFDFREQVDLAHVMVPPSIARHPARKVGVNGEELAMFAPQSELKEYPNGVFLTDDSLELAPHIDTVAMLDTGEPGIGGVHGHEAGNGMRSPGRVMDGGASGLAPMYLMEGVLAPGAGSEELYASAPTPASLHNYYQKKLTPGLNNGIAFKGIAVGKHEVYHFGAGLRGAELTRVRSKAQLFELFPGDLDVMPLPSELAKDILALADVPYRKESGAGYDALVQRFGQVQAAPGSVQLPLTAAEEARWSAGVPAQQCSQAQVDLFDCPSEPDLYGDVFVKAQVWEQFAYASKLFRSGSSRSIALEFDFPCLAGDGTRTEQAQRIAARQLARPLARLISDLKAAGLYDRTVIAVYTIDGSRRPAATSFGNDGKGTIVLAGGRIRGGYYGDILITGDAGTGHTYAFRPPDPATGELLPAVSDWRDLSARTPSGSVWRTVAKAMGIPENEYVGKFNALIDDAVPMDFMLRS